MTADSSVSPTGTPVPRPAPSSEVPVRDLGAIARASISAVRGCVADLRRHGASARRVFAALAVDQGWASGDVAKVCALDRRSVPRLAASCPPDWLAAAALCLGDDRLTHAPRQDRSTPVLLLPAKRS